MSKSNALWEHVRKDGSPSLKLSFADIHDIGGIEIDHSFLNYKNESLSANIKWGIKQHAVNGTSKLYNRKCYGYTNTSDGSLIIKAKEAENVNLIFSMYIQGKSMIGIVFELEKMGIKSPTGKGKYNELIITFS